MFQPIKCSKSNDELSNEVEKVLSGHGLTPPARFDGELLNPFDAESKFANSSHAAAIRNHHGVLAEILIQKCTPIPFAVRTLKENPWVPGPGSYDPDLQDQIMEIAPATAQKLREEGKRIAVQRFQETMERERAQKEEKQKAYQEYLKQPTRTYISALTGKKTTVPVHDPNARRFY